MFAKGNDADGEPDTLSREPPSWAGASRGGGSL